MDFTCALGIQEFGTSHHHSFGGILKNYFNLTESCPGRHSASERSNRKSCFFKLLLPQMSIPPCSPEFPSQLWGFWAVYVLTATFAHLYINFDTGFGFAPCWGEKWDWATSRWIKVVSTCISHSIIKNKYTTQSQGSRRWKYYNINCVQRS